MDEIHENDVVALLVDKPDIGLRRGDIGTVIQVFEASTQHPAGLIVEFVDQDGKVQAQADITDATQVVRLRYSPALQAA
jgi:Domain of unknown function (DUF4926)